MTAKESDAETPLQRALIAVEKAHAKLDALERAQAEPIAVIGIGCRFPGGGQGPESFWAALAAGSDGVREIPETRWPKGALNGAGRGTRWAGLVDDVDTFDPEFFGISPREAMSLDPQQRLLLEMTWEAFEDASVVPQSLVGSATGVFVGISTDDYKHQTGTPEPGERDLYALTGIMASNAAGRLSFVLGLQGPAVALDTACSSSLVAIHLACQSLRTGETTACLAAGVNLILAPQSMAAIASTQALSPDGRCRAFDAEANGFVRGEGCGVVMLKRLSDARRDGNRIRALIRGSAANQDGRSTGLTTPNVLAQQALLRQALSNARVSPHEVSYVETHGTGTSLGDPVEYEALREVLGAPRPDGETCVLGALKTNVGHLEAAAGVAGFIKVVLALEHGSIPRNLHFRTVNPHISLGGTPFVIPTQAVLWPAGQGTRRAGVSSFGMSGTNAHIVLEEAPADTTPSAPAAGAPAPNLLVLSAKTPEALRQQAQRLAAHIAAHGEQALNDIAFTAAVGRSHHAHRLAVAADSTATVIDRLNAFLQGEARPGLSQGWSRNRASKVAFVFPGQGGQWLGMGRALLAEEPVFRAVIEECDRAMRGLADWSLSSVLRGEGDDADLRRVDVIQPAVFAMQVALAALWRSWGVEPVAVVGHSMGEIAAAHVIGTLSLYDACRVVCVRSRLVRRVSGQGGMAVIDLPADEVAAAVTGEPAISIAAVNGPRTTVVSGARDALARLLGRLETGGIFCRMINVDYASHGPQMDALKDQLVDQLRDVRARPATLPISMYSTVTGAKLDAALGVGYWQDNLRQPVRFWPAVEAMSRDGIDTFIEINPHPILLPAIADGLKGDRHGAAVVPSLRREEGGRAAMLGSLGTLYALGYDVDFSRLHPDGGRPGGAKVVTLPGYAWQRERYWTDPRDGSVGAAQPRSGHAWLGPCYRSQAERGTLIWQGDLGVEQAPHLREHQVDGATIIAGAVWLEAALHVAHARGLSGLVDVELVEMLALGPAGTTTVQIVARGSTFEVLSAPRSDEGDWTLHARGRFVTDGAAPSVQPSALADARARCPQVITADEFYEQARERGVQYGERFAALDRVWLGRDEALGEVVVKGAEPGRWIQEPWVLDACLQVLGATADQDDATYLPISVGGWRGFGRLQDRGWAHATRRRSGGVDLTGDVRVYDQTGQLLCEATDVRLHKVRESRLDRWNFAVAWEEQRRAASDSPSPRAGKWIVLGDGALGAAVIQRLQAAGAACVQLRKSEVESLPAVLQGTPEPAGIVHLWGAQDQEPEGESVSGAGMGVDMVSAQAWGCASLLSIVKLLTGAVLQKAPRLWLVTRAAQAVAPGDGVRVTHAPLWGFARTLAHEHPELRCSCVDLPAGFDDADLDALAVEIRQPGAEREIAIRAHKRFVPRLVRAGTPAPREPERPALSPDASYLISGGLGALGLHVADALARRGARHLVLVGRRGAGAAAQAAIDELVAAGVEVRVATADVSRADQLAQVLRSIPDGAPLRGVVHAAGVLDDTTVLRAEWPQFESVFAPKVAGAWNLHASTRQLPLEFFVMFSSAAAVLGSPGQANYAAANAFLDALAHHRRAAGLPALSIDWGPWGDVGLAAARADRGSRLAAQGVRSLSPAQAIAAFDALLASDVTQATVLRLDPPRWRNSYPHVAELPFFSLLMQPTGGQVGTTLRAAVRHELEALDLLPRRLRLEEYLRTEMARVLRLAVSKIHPSTPIANLGFDSLMALEFRNRAEVALDVGLPASLLWTYRTIDALASFLATKMGLPLDEPGADDPVPESSSQSVSQGLSEQEAEAALMAKLEALEVDAE